MHPVLQGVIFGLTISVMLGPAFLTLIQTSIHEGVKKALVLVLGISLSDLTLVLLGYLGTLQMLSGGRNMLLFGLIGGAILIIFGMITYARKIKLNGLNGDQPDEEEPDENPSHSSLTFYFFKGYFLNVLNPFIWIFWISVMVTISATYEAHPVNVRYFFAGVLLTVVSMDILKALVADRVKKYLHIKFLRSLNRIVGMLLIGFGVFLIIRTLVLNF